MSNEIAKVGVIGTGMIGSLHAGILTRQTSGSRVVAVMDIDQDRAAAVAADCGGARAFTDANALINYADVDAVLIASPDAFHAQQALACIAAGKPVLCEKPMATTRLDAERILHAEMTAGRRLVQVGFMREYDRAHKDLVNLVRRGDIGRALRFRGIHMNPLREKITTVEKSHRQFAYSRHSLGTIHDGHRDQQRACAVGARPTRRKPQRALCHNPVDLRKRRYRDAGMERRFWLRL